MQLWEAQNLCMEIKAEFGGGLRPVKWKEVFKDEEDLVNHLREVPVPKHRNAPYYTFQGYTYIFSYAEYLRNGRQLSPKQMIQAKRLALEIFKAWSIREYLETLV